MDLVSTFTLVTKQYLLFNGNLNLNTDKDSLLN